MYTPPTADSISQDLRASVNAEIPEADAFTWPNNLYVALKVFGQALRALYLRLQAIHEQAFVSTATGDYLDLHATEEGITRLAGTFAGGNVIVAGDNGTTLTAGTRVDRVDGKVFDLVADITISGGSTIAQVVAEDVGKAYNCVPGTPLPLETPLAGVTSITVDPSGIKGGTDDESDSSLRARMLDRKRNPAHGGSPSEVIQWIRDNKAGVTRIFVQRATPGPGELTVVFMMDDNYANGVPQAGDIADVVAILNTNYPASAIVHVVAPTLVAINVSISSLTPNTGAVQSQVTAELKAAILRLAEPGSSSADFVFSKSWIDEAISNAIGEDSHRISSPSSDISFGVSSDGTPELATLGTVVFP